MGPGEVPILGPGLSDSNHGWTTTALAVVAVATIPVCVFLEILVVLFNIPKFVVPPHMRSDPGAIAARRARRTAQQNRRSP